MCGIVGFSNFKEDISRYKNVIQFMSNKIEKRGPDQEGEFITPNVCFGHKRLVVIDKNGGRQPMTFNYFDNKVTSIAHICIITIKKQTFLMSAYYL